MYVLAEKRKSQTLDRARAIIQQLLSEGATILIPASTIAEVRRGKYAAGIDRVLNSHKIVDIDRSIASQAAEILHKHTLDSTFMADAFVISVASQVSTEEVFVITSDPKDLKMLASILPRKIHVVQI